MQIRLVLVHESDHSGRCLEVLRWQISSRAIVFTGSVPVSQHHVRSVFQSCEFWPMPGMEKYYAPECKLEQKGNKDPLNFPQKTEAMEKL